MNMRKRLFKVYLDGHCIGTTSAVSSQNAISMVRYRNGLLYLPMRQFKAVCTGEEVTHPVNDIRVNRESESSQISIDEYLNRN